MRPKLIIALLVLFLLPSLAFAAGTATLGPTMKTGPYAGWNTTIVSSNEAETVVAVPATAGKQICFTYEGSSAGSTTVTMKSGTTALMAWITDVTWGRSLLPFVERCTAAGAELNVTNSAAIQIYVGIIWRKF